MNFACFVKSWEKVFPCLFLQILVLLSGKVHVCWFITSSSTQATVSSWILCQVLLVIVFCKVIYRDWCNSCCNSRKPFLSQPFLKRITSPFCQVSLTIIVSENTTSILCSNVISNKIERLSWWNIYSIESHPCRLACVGLGNSHFDANEMLFFGGEMKMK